MPNQLFLKEEADKVMQLKGNLRGDGFYTHYNYIKHKKGEEGIRQVEEKMAELGYPFKFKELKPMGWYKNALSILILLVVKEIFNWTDDVIFDMGHSAPKYSFVVVLLTRYLISPRRGFEMSPKYWQKNFDVGMLEATEFNEKEKYILVRVKEYKTHPVTCIFHAGYFLRIAQFLIKNEKITIKETRCMFKGDPYHEYLINWE